MGGTLSCSKDESGFDWEDFGLRVPEPDYYEVVLVTSLVVRLAEFVSSPVPRTAGTTICGRYNLNLEHSQSKYAHPLIFVARPSGG